MLSNFLLQAHSFAYTCFQGTHIKDISLNSDRLGNKSYILLYPNTNLAWPSNYILDWFYKLSDSSLSGSLMHKTFRDKHNLRLALDHRFNNKYRKIGGKLGKRNRYILILHSFIFSSMYNYQEKLQKLYQHK